jgi:AsmA family protein
MRWKKMVLAGILVAAALISAVFLIIINYDYNKFKPQIESAFKEATSRELLLRGNLELKIGFYPTLTVSNATLKNATWGSRPQMAEIERFEVQLSLVPLVFRRIDVKRLILVSPDILIETNPAGESNLHFFQKVGSEGTKKQSPTEGKAKLSVNEVSIKDGRLVYRNGITGKTYALMLERFDASAGSVDSPLKVALNGSYNGKPFEVKGNLVPLASLADAGRPWPFNLNIDAAGASVSLDGTIRDVPNFLGADIKVALKSKDAARMGDFLGTQLPLQGALEMTCKLTDPRPKVYQLADLKLTAGSSDLQGTIAVNIAESRPLLTADLRSKKLDLRAPSEKEKISSKTAKPAPARDKIFPDSPLPLETLRSADATVSLKAAEVFTSQLALQDLNLSLAVKDSRLSVRPVTAVVGGGSLNGQLDLEPQGAAAQVTVLVTISRLDVGAMLRELKQTNIVEGHVDARINASGRGDSVAGLMSGLSGTTYAIMGEGRINNKYISLLSENIGSDIFRIINPVNKESPITGVKCIVCGFKIRNGIAETTAFVINGDYMSLIGDGTVNLRTERIDFNINPVPKQGAVAGITGGLSLSLGELTTPLKLTGTLAHPSLAVDFQRGAVAAGKALGGEKLLGQLGLGGAPTGKSPSDKELCPLAVKAAQQGVKLSLTGEKQEKGAPEKMTEGVEKSIGEIGRGLKRFFGK